MSTHPTVSELLSRWEDFRARGVIVTAEEICRDAPELLEEFRHGLAAIAGLDRLLRTETGTAAGPTAAPPPGRDAGGPEVPGYEILGELGRGGMGVVYRARSLLLERVVALKMLRADTWADEEERRRFRREGQAMARLEHRHVVPVFAADEHDGRPYFTMKFLPGGNLAEQLPALTLDPRRAVAVLEKVARAVHYLHQQKILHRDLKPLNILLDEGGEPYVSDFGLAKFLEPGLELTTPGAPLGTWPYMAPEQVLGQHHLLGPATDVWALGVILYEVLTGRRPFTGEDKTDMVKQILHEAPTPPGALRPDLDMGLEGIVVRCLQKEPARRYPSAGALADDLAAYLRGERGMDRPRGLRRVWAGLVRHRVAGVVAAAALAVWVASQVPIGNSGDPTTDTANQEPAVVMTLLPARGTPARSRWILGEKKATTDRAPDGALRLSSPRLALLELLEAVPWPRFRLEAEVRHDQSADGNAGVFFNYRQTRRDQKDFHAFGKIEFADLGRLKGSAHLLLGTCPVADPESVSQNACGAPHWFGFLEQPRAEECWRTMAVEVTSGEIRAYWGNHAFAKKALAGVPWSGDPAVPGGLGLFVDRGTASFRNLALRRLP